MSNLVELMAAVSAKREELTQQVQNVLKEGLQQFMRDHSEIKALTWCQYTPYFNDGDECVFRVGEISFSTEPQNLEDIDREVFWGEEGEDWYSYDHPDTVSKETFDAFRALIKVLNDSEEDLEVALGNHVKVLVTADGIEIEEFEHD